MSTIAVIGYGHIGGTLARKWSEAGHDVTLGARDPQGQTLRALAEAIGAEVAPTFDAVDAAEVVAFAIPGASMADTVAALGARLDGKVVIDATNNVGGEVMHSAAPIAAAAPGASYFRAFNTFGWEMLDQPVVGEAQADLFFCGPDGASRTQVEQLIVDVGLRPVWVGGPEDVDVVDGMLRLWFTLVVKRGLGRRLAFRTLED